VPPKGGNFDSLIGPGLNFNTRQAYELNCRAGTFLTGINVTTNLGVARSTYDRGNFFNLVPNSVEGLGPLSCSAEGSETFTGSSAVPEPLSPSFPGSAPVTSFQQSPTGYTGIKLRAGLILDAITLVTVGGEEQGPFGGIGGGPVTVACPSGQVITGLFGDALYSIPEGVGRVMTVGLRCKVVN
jgi:hypothetical protein